MNEKLIHKSILFNYGKETTPIYCYYEFYINGAESPLISFAVGGMKATQYKDSNFLNKFCFFFKLLYICIYF